jgi:peptide/nickel transport system ATP-binding protein
MRSGGRTVVSVDNFAYAPGEVTFLFGESGIGKSLICKALYGLIDPDELSGEIDGRDYADYRRDPAIVNLARDSFFVFQEPSSHLNPLMRIADQLNEGSLRQDTNNTEILRHLWRESNDAAIQAILALYPKPYRPSGGEKQRILLAMAFKKINLIARRNINPNDTFFVFDEPTGSLDNNYRNLFLQLLFSKFSQRPFTAIVITHDYSIISEIDRNYRPLLPRIHFKELARKGEASVELNDFSAEHYLRWLGHPRSEAPSSTDATAVLQVDSLFRIFNREHRLYSDAARTIPVDLTIHRGEIVYVKAASGVGKTTLAKIIMGLYAPQQFGMQVCGERYTAATARRVWPQRLWGSKMGMVFQHADEALDLAASVQDTFKGLPRMKSLTTPELRARLAELFDPDEITDTFLQRTVKYLSGGQKQRLNLLRTLMLNTDLLVLDEPLNGLDFLGVKRVLALLEERRLQGCAILLISHNEEIFDHLIDENHIFYLD